MFSPGHRMQLHDDPFLGREIPAFSESRRGPRSCPDRANSRRAVTRVDSSSPARCDVPAPRIFREALAMALRIRIAAFHAQRQGAEHGIGGLQFVGKVLERSSDLTRANSSTAKMGLFRKSSAPASMPRSLSSRSVRPVIRTKGISRVAGFSFELAAKVKARLPRHDHVGKDQSGSCSCTSASACSASEAVITSIGARRATGSSSPGISGWSSTTRIRGATSW